LPQRSERPLEPRKSPVQARSAVTVDAILDATIQVLLKVGKARLTTTRVAQRAGVSVGTLYQYFPNKSAVLRAVLKRHLDNVMGAVEVVCVQQRGRSLEEMATVLVTAYLEAKMKNFKTSSALYAVGADVDGAKIAQQMAVKANRMIAAMLTSATEQLTSDPELVASILQTVIAGVARRLLESASPEKEYDILHRELIFLACTYLEACCARAPVKTAGAADKFSRAVQ
jgi:AcrR family transcriptional regulator